MSRRVLIVPDKFKGTLTAQEAAAAMRQGWHQVWPEDELLLLPMSDGGDGFGEVLASLLRLEAKSTPTVDAAHRPCQGIWWHGLADGMAVIESARIIGLALLPPRRFHPFQLDTFGLGAVLEAAVACGARHQLIGIGGSATNDGGFGLAKALGWRFMDSAGQEIRRWTELRRLVRLQPPLEGRSGFEFVVAVDVQNLLLGPTGATSVYGPQKGLTSDDFQLAETCLERLTAVAREHLGSDAALEPGSGAAGGLGFGLRAFLNARLESGFQLFATYARLEERIREADVVVTGEGEIDSSTMMGKGVGEVAQMCRSHQVPCLGLAGRLAVEVDGDSPFAQLHGIVPTLTSAEEAKASAASWLVKVSAVAARQFGGKRR